MKNIIWLDSSYYEDDELEDEDDDEFDKDSLSSKLSKVPNIINTPFGIYKMDMQLANPYKDREFWTAHTDFIITEDLLEKIENAAGVDGLRILSPYSFIICVGLLFDSDIVRYQINKSLGVETLKEDTLDDTVTKVQTKYIETINKELEIVSKTSDYWIVYMFPNGEITSIACKDKLEWAEKLNLFQIMKRLSYGILLIPEEGTNEPDKPKV